MEVDINIAIREIQNLIDYYSNLIVIETNQIRLNILREKVESLKQSKKILEDIII